MTQFKNVFVSTVLGRVAKRSGKRLRLKWKWLKVSFRSLFQVFQINAAQFKNSSSEYTTKYEVKLSGILMKL